MSKAFFDFSDSVVKYSVKTCHPYFYNQLYHGADEYGLAGSWLSDALNTNIHTFEVAPAFIAIEHHLLGYIRQLFGWTSEQVIIIIIVIYCFIHD